MMLDRRRFLAATGALLAAGCATPLSRGAFPPIVFVHGNGDTASVWETAFWRFESNGWPRERLYAADLPYPLARDVDDKPQPGRTSAAEYTAFLQAEVERVLRVTGAEQVVLVGNSRGGYPIRDYIQTGGGAARVSHAILCGVPNHGVWMAMPGLPDGSEFAGAGPFLKGLNAAKNADGDEVAGPVKWMTIRSDSNDKFAQPDGVWLGKRGQPTGVTYEGPALKGATNVVLPRADHRETGFSPAAFDAMFRFITGRAPATLEIVPEDRVVLGGKVTGRGVSSADPASGNFTDNLPLPGAQLRIYALHPATGERRSEDYAQAIGADGKWGPFSANAGTNYEFALEAPGYATTHVYRSPFPRSTALLNLQPERIAAARREAPAPGDPDAPARLLRPAARPHELRRPVAATRRAARRRRGQFTHQARRRAAHRGGGVQRGTGRGPVVATGWQRGIGAGIDVLNPVSSFPRWREPRDCNKNAACGRVLHALSPRLRGDDNASGVVQARILRQVRHQKLHLVHQDAAIAQDEVFPQAGHVRRVQQVHARLLRRAAALAVVAAAAGRHHVHPVVLAVLGEGDDVLAGQLFFVEQPAAIGADVAVARKQLAVGEARLQLEGIDVRHALGADDAVDPDDRLLAAMRIDAAAEHGDIGPGLPANLVGGVVQHGLLQRNPRLGQPLGRQLQNLQIAPPSVNERRPREADGTSRQRGKAQYTLF